MAGVPAKTLRGRRDLDDRLPVDPTPGGDATMADRRIRALRRDCRIRSPAHHGVLARTHPAGDLLFSPSRHRGDHERKFRRGVDCPDHRAIRVWNGARIELARRTEGAAPVDA